LNQLVNIQERAHDTGTGIKEDSHKQLRLIDSC